MVRKKRPKPIEKTAYHEAGHAVLALRLCTGFRKVTIIPDTARGSLGLSSDGLICRKSGTTQDALDCSDPECSSRIRRSVERRLVVLMAGFAAEMLFSGRRNRAMADSDFNHAYDLAMRISYSEDEANCLLDWAIERAKGLLQASFGWKGVIAVANALLKRKTLVRKDAKTIYWDALRALVKPIRIVGWKETPDGSRTAIIERAK